MSDKQNPDAKKTLNIKTPPGNPGGKSGSEEMGMETLQGQFLVAMPMMGDARFKESVLYVVEHNDQGAMAIGVNEVLPKIVLGDILADIDLKESNKSRRGDIVVSEKIASLDILKGGPVQTNRGFVVHSMDNVSHGTFFQINEQTGISSNMEILVALAMDTAPRQALFALGYCGWSPGQLENELTQNAWLTVPFSAEILFETAFEERYDKSLESLGITRASLSAFSGHG